MYTEKLGEDRHNSHHILFWEVGGYVGKVKAYLCVLIFLRLKPWFLYFPLLFRFSHVVCYVHYFLDSPADVPLSQSLRIFLRRWDGVARENGLESCVKRDHR